MKISVVVPIYNEGESVQTSHDAIVDVLRARLPELDYEIIYVDDGSQDDSFAQVAKLCARYNYVRGLKFANNCGSHMAIRAGFDYARGDIACFLACDLQEPPELIVRALEVLKAPVQVVWAVRNSREDSLSERLFANVFYKLARLIVTKNIPPAGASMFVLGADALKAMRSYKERNLTLEGAFATMGFKQAHILYERKARKVGKSKWTLAKKLKLFADFFVGYSYVPIRLMSYLGMVTAALGFIYTAVVVVNRLFFSLPIEGWSSLMVVVLVMGGIQMIMLGIIGEYVWRSLDESRSRPRYIIEEMLNDPNERPVAAVAAPPSGNP